MVSILGKVVSGYRVRKDDQGESHWKLLGKKSPQTPQMFYPTENTDPILPGDTVAARCTMYNNQTSLVKIG